MRAHRSRRLLFLPLAVTLAAACGTPQSEPPVGASGRRAGGGSTLYRAPDDAFAIDIPAGWKVQREEEDGAYMTSIRPEQSGALDLSIMTIKDASAGWGSAVPRSHMLTGASKPYFQGWLNGLKEQARVEGTGVVGPTRLGKFDALMMEVTYYRGDANDPRDGQCIFLSSGATTFLISLTGSRSRFAELKEIISTMRIEP